MVVERFVVQIRQNKEKYLFVAANNQDWRRVCSDDTAKHGSERRVLRLRAQLCGELDSRRVRCSIARRFSGELSVIADRDHSSARMICGNWERCL